MLASLAWAMIWQSVASFSAALDFDSIFHARHAREEEFLRQTFPGYADYARRALLPRLSRKANLVCNFNLSRLKTIRRP